MIPKATHHDKMDATKMATSFAERISPLSPFPSESVALVTGGSRGIGAATARCLAAWGANVILTYRNKEEQAVLVAEGIRDMGCRAEVVSADIREESQVLSLFKYIRENFGRLDAAVLNSGITSDGLLATMGQAKWNDVISTNLTGNFLCAREATKVMLGTGGSIVLVSSTSGVAGRPGQGNYAASKGGIIALAKSLAQEVGRHGIRVNAVAPGFIETDMVRRVSRSVIAEAVSAIDLGRLGRPDEVAQAICFLASPVSSYITGKVLTVDGGMING